MPLALANAMVLHAVSREPRLSADEEGRMNDSGKEAVIYRVNGSQGTQLGILDILTITILC